MADTLFSYIFQTYVWVINDETQFKKLYDLGVAGIMTDYPTKLKIFLDQNPEYNNNIGESSCTATSAN